MPVHAVRKNGKIIGWQWGNHGKIYRGKDAKKKAADQGYAAMKSGGYSEPGMTQEQQAAKLYGAKS